VLDDRFVEPCWSLSSMVENIAPGFSAQKGVSCWSYSNMQTMQPSRRFYGIKSKAQPRGMLFNFCPWCGADISEPFMDKEESHPPRSGDVGHG
jgi:hypothetical protein